MADGTRATLIVYGVVAALFIGTMWGLWQFLSTESPPDQQERKLPTVSIAETESLAPGETRADVFDAIGRGQHDNTKYISLGVKHPYTQECYLYRIEGGQPDDQGHFPLFELCFHDGMYAPTDGGRFRDDF